MVTRHHRKRLDDTETTTPKRKIVRERLDSKPSTSAVKTPRITLLDAVCDPKLFLPSLENIED